MIHFESDYIAGAHPKILEKLIETNMDYHSGYGTDDYCTSAAQKIKEACGCPNADVEFLVGGTQTNAVVISTMLHDSEGVISAQTGHINVHESGAIEYTSHKVLTIPEKDGKIDAKTIKTFIDNFYADDTYPHMVYPGMVYISHPTEYGTLYSKNELEAISKICKTYEIPLFMDGARLGYGLMSDDTDLTLIDIANLCDVFYIGGTKVGALCGEAVVFTKNNKPKHFMTSVKKRGALLAKGRVLGIQFDTLFTDNLYFEIGKYAIEMAEKLNKIFEEKNIKTFLKSPTNQQFVILENNQMNMLKEKVGFSFWEKYDEEHTVVRFATSWSTTQEDLDILREIL